MPIFHKWFHELCPVCNSALTAEKSKVLIGHVVKACPHGHYKKEFLPALEGYVEHYSIKTGTR